MDLRSIVNLSLGPVFLKMISELHFKNAHITIKLLNLIFFSLSYKPKHNYLNSTVVVTTFEELHKGFIKEGINIY